MTPETPTTSLPEPPALGDFLRDQSFTAADAPTKRRATQYWAQHMREYVAGQTGGWTEAAEAELQKDLAAFSQTAGLETGQFEAIPAAFRRGYHSARSALQVAQGLEDPINRIDLAEAQLDLAAVPGATPAVDAFNREEGFWASASHLIPFYGNPGQIISQALAENAATMLPSVGAGLASAKAGAATGAAISGPGAPGGATLGAAIGGAFGTFLASYKVEETNRILQYLQERHGADLTKPETVALAWADPAVRKDVEDRAQAGAFMTAAFDAASFPLAGRLSRAIKAGAAPTLSRATGAWAADAFAQGGIGSAGYAASQLATGDKITPQEAMMEGVVDVASGSLEALGLPKEVAAEVEAARRARMTDLQRKADASAPPPPPAPGPSSPLPPVPSSGSVPPPAPTGSDRFFTDKQRKAQAEAGAKADARRAASTTFGTMQKDDPKTYYDAVAALWPRIVDGWSKGFLDPADVADPALRRRLNTEIRSRNELDAARAEMDAAAQRQKQGVKTAEEWQAELAANPIVPLTESERTRMEAGGAQTDIFATDAAAQEAIASEARTRLKAVALERLTAAGFTPQEVDRLTARDPQAMAYLLDDPAAARARLAQLTEQDAQAARLRQIEAEDRRRAALPSRYAESIGRARPDGTKVSLEDAEALHQRDLDNEQKANRAEEAATRKADLQKQRDLADPESPTFRALPPEEQDARREMLAAQAEYEASTSAFGDDLKTVLDSGALPLPSTARLEEHPEGWKAPGAAEIRDGFLSQLTPAQRMKWTSRQAPLDLDRVRAAAVEMGFDFATPADLVDALSAVARGERVVPTLPPGSDEVTGQWGTAKPFAFDLEAAKSRARDSRAKPATAATEFVPPPQTYASDDDIPFSRTASPAKPVPPLPESLRAEIEQELQKEMAETGKRVRLYNTTAELRTAFPAFALDNLVEGFYLDADNTAHVVWEGLSPDARRTDRHRADAARRVVLHEILGHADLATFLGADYLPTMREAIAAIPDGMLQDIVRRYSPRLSPAARTVDADRRAYSAKLTEADISEIGEEIAAAVAEIPRLAPGLWDRLKALLRRYARTLGLKIHLTENDVRVLLQRKREWMQGRASAETPSPNAQAPRESRAAAPDSPAFKAWFKNSAVVDEQGQPLVVFHGGQIFDAFRDNPQAQANFAIANEDAAQTYAAQYRTREAEIKPLYLSILHPLRLDEMPRSGDPIIAKAKADGYDGIIAYDSDASNRGRHLAFAFFRPGQAKLAAHPEETSWGYRVRGDGNKGTYDPRNPDIRFSRAARQSRAQTTLALDTPLGTQLPPDLAGIVPNYQDHPVRFAAPLDKWLYYATPSEEHTAKHDARLKALASETGLGESRLRALGRELRQRLSQATAFLPESESVNVPEFLPAIVGNETGVRFSRSARTQKSPGEEITLQSGESSFDSGGITSILSTSTGPRRGSVKTETETEKEVNIRFSRREIEDELAAASDYLRDLRASAFRIGNIPPDLRAQVSAAKAAYDSARENLSQPQARTEDPDEITRRREAFQLRRLAMVEARKAYLALLYEQFRYAGSEQEWREFVANHPNEDRPTVQARGRPPLGYSSEVATRIADAEQEMRRLEADLAAQEEADHYLKREADEASDREHQRQWQLSDQAMERWGFGGESAAHRRKQFREQMLEHFELLRWADEYLARQTRDERAHREQESQQASQAFFEAMFPPSPPKANRADAAWWKDWIEDNLATGETAMLKAVFTRMTDSDMAFRYGKTESKAAPDISAAISTAKSRLKTDNDGRDADDIEFRGPNGYLDLHDADTPRPYIRSPRADSAGKKEGGGSQLYMAALDWIHNNGKQVKDDPGGLSPINHLRRTANFISSALRWRTVKHLKPHADQMVTGWDARKGFAHNLQALLLAERREVAKAIPEFSELSYDFAADQFTRQGQPLTGADIDALAVARDPEKTGVGLGTLARAVIVSAALREQAAGRSVRDVLGGDEGSRFGSQGPGGVGRIFYSRAADYGISHRPREDGPQADSVTADYQDLLTHPQYYTAMEPAVIRETVAQLRRVKNRPTAPVTIYRAGPKAEMNTGDWVSLSREYARTHAFAASTDDTPYKVWASEVPASQVRWGLDDIAEWGYFGETVPAKDTGVRFSRGDRAPVEPPTVSAEELARELPSQRAAQAASNTYRTPPLHQRLLDSITESFRRFRKHPELSNDARWTPFREGYRQLQSAGDLIARETTEQVREILKPIFDLPVDTVDPDTYYRLGSATDRIRRREKAVEEALAGVGASNADPSATRAYTKAQEALQSEAHKNDLTLTRELDRKLEDLPYHLARKFILFADLAWRSENLEAQGPRDVTKETAGASSQAVRERDRLSARIAQHPHSAAIEESIKRHYAAMEAMQDELIRRGYLIPEEYRNPFYFPHHVLDYHTGALGSPNFTTEDPFRGYLENPVGSPRDVEADYLKAVYQHLYLAKRHNAEQDFVTRHILGEDITEKVRLQLQEEEDAAAKKQRRAPRIVTREMAQADHNLPAGFQKFTVDKRLPMTPVQVLDPKALAEALGTTIAEDEGAADVIARLGGDVKVTVDMLKTILAQRPGEQIVIPAPLARELKRLLDAGAREVGQKGIYETATRSFVNWWKAVKLFLPLNVIRYTYGNLTTDVISKWLITNPSLGKHFSRSIHELRAAARGEPPSPEMRDAIRLGVLDSLTDNEARITADLPWQDEFKEMQHLPSRWWNNVKRYTGNFGSKLPKLWERFIRYARYLQALEQLQGDPAKVNYGGANLDYVRTIGDTAPGTGDARQRQAARIARDTFVDYNDIGVNGDWLRKHLMPFYSWTEGNVKYHANLFRNAWRQAELAAPPGSHPKLRASARVAALLAQLSAPWILLYAFNHRDDDAEELEKGLSDEDRRRLHITLGRDEETGKIRLIYLPEAMDDVLGWIGGQTIVQQIPALLNGETTVGNALQESATASLNKAAGSINPMFKGIYETASGKSTFPDITDQRKIPAYDKWWKLLGNLTDDNVVTGIRTLADKDFYPSKTGWETASQMFLQVRYRDPETWAYYSIREKAEEFSEEKTGNTKDFSSEGKDTQVLRNFRRALYTGDLENAHRFYLRMLDYGYTAERLEQSIRAQHPLSGLRKDHQKEFLAGLSDFDKWQFEQALAHYAKMEKLKGKGRQMFPTDQLSPAAQQRRADALRQKVPAFVRGVQPAP